MYKSNNFDGLRKEDIKRIQKIVAEIHARSIKEDLKNVQYVEGYIQGRRSVRAEIGDIADLIYMFADAVKNGEYQNVEDIVADIRLHGDMLVELIQDIEQGE